MTSDLVFCVCFIGWLCKITAYRTTVVICVCSCVCVTVDCHTGQSFIAVSSNFAHMCKHEMCMYIIYKVMDLYSAFQMGYALPKALDM